MNADDDNDHEGSPLHTIKSKAVKSGRKEREREREATATQKRRDHQSFGADRLA